MSFPIPRLIFSCNSPKRCSGGTARCDSPRDDTRSEYPKTFRSASIPMLQRGATPQLKLPDSFPHKAPPSEFLVQLHHALTLSRYSERVSSIAVRQHGAPAQCDSPVSVPRLIFLCNLRKQSYGGTAQGYLPREDT